MHHFNDVPNEGRVRRAPLALAVSCALALSLGAGAVVASADRAELEEADSAEQMLMAAALESVRSDEIDTLGPGTNRWAEENEMLRAIASGEVDPTQWMADFALPQEQGEASSEPPVLTATHVVTNCDDEGAGSLRDAIQDSDYGDVIDMSSLSCGTISLETPLLVTTDNLTLIGQMSGSQGKYLRLPIIQAAPENDAGLMWHSGDGAFSLEKLTLQDSRKYGSLGDRVSGGCLHSDGDVSLTDVTITGCIAKDTADRDVLGGAVYAETGITMVRSRVGDSTAQANSGAARGGGLFTPGSLSLEHSTLHDNHAASTSGTSTAGGGHAQGTVWIDRSTISGNSAALTGGLSLSTGDASIRIKSSTVSGNTATGNGKTGGVFVKTSGHFHVGNNTITDNVTQGTSGPGLYAQGAQLQLDSNIISGNRSVSGTTTHYVDAGFGHAPEGSHNLIGWLGPNSKPAPVDTIQQVNTPLEPLDGNGGLTMTHALKKGSWAFNHGEFTPDIIEVIPNPGGFPIFIFDPADDQTDAPRTVGTDTDIGSYESDALFIGRFENKPLL